MMYPTLYCTRAIVHNSIIIVSDQSDDILGRD